MASELTANKMQLPAQNANWFQLCLSTGRWS